MELSSENRNVGIAVMRIVCAVVFASLSFLYLYFYQADVLSATQHVMSGGATHYNRTIGAVLITIGLLLLQWAVYAFTRLRGLCHFLTYFPSALFLAVVTSVHISDEGNASWDFWWWLTPLLLAIWTSLMYVATKSSFSLVNTVFPISLLLTNVLLICVMFLFVGFVGNSNDVFHYRMKVERLLAESDYDGALQVGKKSLKTDKNLTMLRIYTLARKGELGDKLFTYPVSGCSADMIPLFNSNVYCIMYPTDSIYKLLGARPLTTQDTNTYLEALSKTHKGTRTVADYKLCGYLIDRDLDGFVSLLSYYYNVDDNLPRHYREALTLYTHLRSNPLLVYHNEVMDTDFEDMQQLERKHKDKNACRLAVFNQYRGTYWAYYDAETNQ